MQNQYKGKEISFGQVLKSLKKKEGFSDLAKDIEYIMTSIMVLLSGPLAGTAFLNAIETAKAVKLIEILKNLREKIISNSHKSLDASEQMEAAYVTICFTAFFDTLNERLTQDILNGLDLSEQEKVGNFNGRIDEHVSASGILVKPSIAYRLKEAEKSLLSVYKVMASRLCDFINGLRFVETADERVLSTIRTAFEGLPEAAMTNFEKQYLDLCIEIPGFFSYISIQTQQEYAEESKEILARISSRLEEIKKGTESTDEITGRLLESELRLAELIMNCGGEIKAGLSDLKDLFFGLPHHIEEEKAHDAAEHIIKKYRDKIKEPIFGSKQNDDGLTFPTIEEAFIPQSFKTLIYKGSERLENKEEWAALPDENDQAEFWARYFNDPDSEENLLLILGEPGIGKSLLTKVLAAQVGSLEQPIINVPLRKADTEKKVEGLICNQINADGDAAAPFNTLKAFTEHLTKQPLTVIFDGYDELQQATGRVYHEFLEDLASFQHECRGNQRPVRIIVTSRANLIDKANIPVNTVVMQLNEFEQDRKEKWIGIWNDANRESFKLAGINGFVLPENSREIDELSGQPLLLLMLALYDADISGKKNALSSNKSITRTELYDELIRRFIRRELEKGNRSGEAEYRTLDSRKQKNMEEKEMKRLGVAALGMFMRGKLSITVEELRNDLKLMKADLNKIPESEKEMLKDEEAFFGSFYFIHDPRPKESAEERYKNSSFEFLHKTFYEFLAADIVLRTVSTRIKQLYERKLKENEEEEEYDENEVSYEKALSDVLLDPKEFFIALSGGLLCSEPVIIQMMTEWNRERFWKGLPNSNVADIVKEVFRELIMTNAKTVRNGRMPKGKSDECCISEERNKPQICAAYLLNLLTTAVVCCKSIEMEEKLWKYTAHYIWLNMPEIVKKEKDKEDKGKKLRFQLEPNDEIILRFTSFIDVEVINGVARFGLRDKSVELDQLDLLRARMSIFGFMRENEQSEVYSLHRTDRDDGAKVLTLEHLAEIGMDVDAERTIRLLYKAQQEGRILSDESIIRLVDALRYCRDEALIQEALNFILAYCKSRDFGGARESTRMKALMKAFISLMRTHRLSIGTIMSIIMIIHSVPLYVSNEIYIAFCDAVMLGLSGYELILAREWLSRLALRILGSESNKYIDRDIDIDIDIDIQTSPAPHEIIKSLVYTDKARDVWEYGDYLSYDYRKCYKKDFKMYLEAIEIAIYRGEAQQIEQLMSFFDDLQWKREFAFGSNDLISCVDVQKLYHAARYVNGELPSSIAMRFYNDFPVRYYADPEGAIYMLCELADRYITAIRRGENQDGDPILRMCRYVLENFNVILERSLSAAALFLKHCIRSLDSNIYKYRRRLLSSCIKTCFNAFVFAPGIECVDRLLSLINVFDCLYKYDRTELVNYFKKNIERIRSANESVAEEIERVVLNQE